MPTGSSLAVILRTALKGKLLGTLKTCCWLSVRLGLSQHGALKQLNLEFPLVVQSSTTSFFKKKKIKLKKEILLLLFYSNPVFAFPLQ